jgi:hypothetical protein
VIRASLSRPSNSVLTGVHVLITVESVADRPNRQQLTTSPKMIAKREAALEEIRKLNPYRDTTDPDAAIANLTRIEACGCANIFSEEEIASPDFVNTSPTCSLKDLIIEQAILLRQQKKMKLGAGIIAATAVAHNVPLVTRNEDDSKHIPGLDSRTLFAITP